MNNAMNTYFKQIQLCIKVIVCLSTIISCDNSFKREYSQLKNSKIEFPDKLKMTFEGRDTIIDDIWNSEFKLVIYKDSLSCTPCYIESLPKWFKIIDKYDSKKFSAIFILCPTKEDEIDIRLLMEMNGFEYPILIDNNNAFRNANSQISSNSLLHTFLLNDNNEVIFIGDPLSNEKINDLFEQEIK